MQIGWEALWSLAETYWGLKLPEEKYLAGKIPNLVTN